MGALFAIEKDGVVYLAADAVKECCGCNFYVNNESNLRLHKMPSGIVIAAMGYMRLTQQLWLRDEWFELKKGEIFNKEFIVTKLLPHFYEAIEGFEEDWNVRKSLALKDTQASFIIAKDADIYVVLSDLGVLKCDKLAVLCDNEAERVMFAYADSCEDEDPEVIIKKTFAFAAKRYSQVSTHGNIINTRDFTIKRMEDVK